MAPEASALLLPQEARDLRVLRLTLRSLSASLSQSEAGEVAACTVQFHTLLVLAIEERRRCSCRTSFKPLFA